MTLLTISEKTPLRLARVGVTCLGLISLLVVLERTGGLERLGLSAVGRLDSCKLQLEYWEKTWAAEINEHSVLVRTAHRHVLATPQTQVPLLQEGHHLVVPNCKVELLTPPDYEYAFLVEVPEFLDEVGKVQFRAQLSSALVHWENRITELRKEGTPVSPLYNDIAALNNTVCFDASEWVARKLADQRYVSRPSSPDLPGLLFEGYGNEKGFLDFPLIIPAYTPAESGKLSGISPLRLIPFYDKFQENGEQRLVFKDFSVAIWETTSLIRDAQGAPMRLVDDIRFRPAKTNRAAFVLHVWAVYFFIDGFVELRTPMAAYLNPLSYILANMAFSYRTGIPLRSQEITAQLPSSFHGSDAETASLERRYPVINWVQSELYGGDNAVMSEDQILRTAGVRFLNVGLR